MRDDHGGYLRPNWEHVCFPLLEIVESETRSAFLCSMKGSNGEHPFLEIFRKIWKEFSNHSLGHHHQLYHCLHWTINFLDSPGNAFQYHRFLDLPLHHISFLKLASCSWLSPPWPSQSDISVAVGSCMTTKHKFYSLVPIGRWPLKSWRDTSVWEPFT